MLRWGWREARYRDPADAPADPNDWDIEDADGLDVDVKDLIAKAFAEAGITTKEKVVLRLKVSEGKKWNETAEAMGVTVEQARYLFQRAIKKLHDWFARKFGPDWHPWFD